MFARHFQACSNRDAIFHRLSGTVCRCGQERVGTVAELEDEASIRRPFRVWIPPHDLIIDNALGRSLSHDSNKGFIPVGLVEASDHVVGIEKSCPGLGGSSMVLSIQSALGLIYQA